MGTVDDPSQRANDLFLAAFGLDPGDRPAFLSRECGDDVGLRAEVESLFAQRDPTRGNTSDWGDRAVGKATEPAGGQRGTVGPYRIIREIGRGGMGVVLLAVRESDHFKHRVAIKVLKRGMDTEDVLRRFQLERQLLAALNHHNIARLFDAGETEDGQPYFAMEHVEGLPIDEYCDRHRLRITQRIGLFRSVCSAVHYAHQNLVVHRDLKADNIVVTNEGVPKLLDFGIAKLINPEISLVAGDPTAPGQRVMTPEFASPEQVRGEPITTASDIYSLGVLLYELVSGHRPYRLRSHVYTDIERVICEVEPEKPSTAVSRIEESELADRPVPGSAGPITPDSVSRTREGRPDRLRKRLSGDIDNIVLMAMRKEPLRRYKSAEEFADDLRRHLEGLPVIARRDTAGYRVGKFVLRHRAGVTAAALIALLLIVGITGTSWLARVAIVERDKAEQARQAVYELAHTVMFDFYDSIQKLDGSLPARALLVETALESLDGLAKSVRREDPLLRRELAAAYHRVGDIRGGIRNPSGADTAGALESYRTALEIRQSLLTASPDDTELQAQVALSHTSVGDMLKLTGDVAGALAAYSETLSIRRALVKADPEGDDARRGLAFALNDVGAAHIRNGDISSARRHYDRSLAIRQELADKQPDNPLLLRALSSGHIRVGGRLEDAGDLQGALDHYQKAVEIRKALSLAEPESGRARRDLAVAHYLAGRTLLSLDRLEQAREHVDGYFNTVKQRATDNPRDARAKRDLAIGYEIKGMVRAEEDDFDGALRGYRRCQALLMSLSEADPDNTKYPAWIAGSYERIGQALALKGDQDGAIRSYRDAIEIVTDLSGNDPSDVSLQEHEAGLLSAMGNLLAETNDRDEAQRRLESALARYETLREMQPSDAGIREGLASTLHGLSKLLAGLGDGDAALEYALKALATGREREPSRLRDLAKAFHMTGDDESAIKTAQEALRLLADASPGPETDDLRHRLETDLFEYRR